MRLGEDAPVQAVVFDNELTLLAHLEKMGVNCELAGVGDLDGLVDTVDPEELTILFSDIRSADDLDGIQFVRELKRKIEEKFAAADRANIKFVLMCDDEEMNADVSRKIAQLADYLGKPVRVHDLWMIIQRYLGDFNKADAVPVGVGKMKELTRIFNDLNLRSIIVDDESSIRRTVKRQLTAISQLKPENISTTADGYRAMREIESDGGRKIKFAFLDKNMPKMDGIELIKRIKAVRPDIIRVLMSGANFPFAESKHAHCNLVKPFDSGAIDLIITNNLKNIKEVQDRLRTMRALHERESQLELKSQKAIIDHLVRQFSVPILSNFTKPQRRPESDGLRLFQGQESVHKMVTATDWDIDRDNNESSELLGIKSLSILEKMAQEFAAEKQKGTPMTLCMGFGDGSAMKELAEIAAEEGRECHQVGIADAVLHKPSELLGKCLLVDELDEEEVVVLKRMINRMNALLLNEFGEDGMLNINLNLRVDQERFRNYLIELAKSDRIKAFAEEKRSYLDSSGKYGKDKNSNISWSEIPFFIELAQDPVAFYDKYFHPILRRGSKIDMRELLDELDLDVRYGDFANLYEDLSGKKQMFTMAHSVRSFSHLEDYDYTVALNEIATRLVPGGVIIDDGIEESYSQRCRIDVLRRIQSHLGEEYRFILIGDKNKPRSVMIQRGVRQKESDAYSFFSDEQVEALKAQGIETTLLDSYEQIWPDHDIKNKFINDVKQEIFKIFNDGVANKTIQPEIARVWRELCFRPIYDKIPLYISDEDDGFEGGIDLDELSSYIPQALKIAEGKLRRAA